MKERGILSEAGIEGKFTIRFTREGIQIRRVLLRLARLTSLLPDSHLINTSTSVVLADSFFSILHIDDFPTPGRLMVNLDQSCPLLFWLNARATI
jgi:hypothetical protein